MANSIINLNIYVNGELTDPTSVEFEDKADTPTFGIKEVVSGNVIVASGVAMTKSSTGKYTHSWATVTTDDHEYEFEVVYNGVTYNRNFVDNFVTAGTTINKTLILPESATYYSSQAEVYNVLGPISGELLEDDFAEGDRGSIWAHLLPSQR